MRRFLPVVFALVTLGVPQLGHSVQCVDIFGAGLLRVQDLPGTVRGQLLNGVAHVRNESGFVKKLELIETARPGQTVDMAYFIFEDDYSSSYLAQKMMAKAAQGVKFRVVVDAFMAEKFMPFYTLLNSQANIEVHLFRPASEAFTSFLRDKLEIAQPDEFIKGLMLLSPDRAKAALLSSRKLQAMLPGIQQTLATQMLGAVGAGMEPSLGPSLLFAVAGEIGKVDPLLAREFDSHLVEFTRRLHHKILMAGDDLRVSFIVGGRNISDEYHLSRGHELLRTRNYPFFDAETSGDLVGQDAAEMRRTFESLIARSQRPGSGLYASPRVVTSEQLAEAEAKLRANAARYAEFHAGVVTSALDGVGFVPFESSGVAMTYSENGFRARRNQKQILDAWIKMIGSAEREINIVSAYFYFSPEVLSAVEGAAARGVRVNIFTNSFTSTDMNIVNVGSYTKFQEWTSRLGSNVTIYELQLGEKQGSLHAKMIEIDSRIVGIGSANTDPRSDRLDSNNFVFVDASADPAIARRIFDSYTVTANEDGLRLPWAPVTAEYVGQFLRRLQENRSLVPAAVQLRRVIDQL